MEKKMDTTARAVLDIMTKTTEYLQPNPATRAKMSMINSMSRMRGQEKGPGYTQTEAILGESMQRFGRELGEESNFGGALIEAGEAMRELGEVKDALDIEVKQNFIDPMQNLHEKDLKEIQHHLKKMEGRRLDFDYKKKRQGKCTDDELKQALEKFDDSKEIAEQSMFNLIESDGRGLQQYLQFSACCTHPSFHHLPIEQRNVKLLHLFHLFLFSLPFAARSPARSPAPLDQPCCRALYDFDPENEGELGFKEGDIITLTNKIDDNWYEGMLHGNSGFFPINYVDILVPLPH
ncbi:SH3 domain containing GRB2 like 2a, endophilin A1 [Notothenia coriiceps]|uniref:SH3 domain containing GRB2 like 2a, endophilin A1 n=1 Tax=Notothenia coriiceps TaxID=8208 RepID=A0A6I9NMD2_9TELE|nr:PREDICTED: endophilin-A1-like [Notothenia coriiceps]